MTEQEKAPPTGWEEDLEALQRENTKLKERVTKLEEIRSIAGEECHKLCNEVEELRAKAREVVEDLKAAAELLNPDDGLAAWGMHRGLIDAAAHISRKFKLSGP